MDLSWVPCTLAAVVDVIFVYRDSKNLRVTKLDAFPLLFIKLYIFYSRCNNETAFFLCTGAIFKKALISYGHKICRQSHESNGKNLISHCMKNHFISSTNRYFIRNAGLFLIYVSVLRVCNYNRELNYSTNDFHFLITHTSLCLDTSRSRL